MHTTRLKIIDYLKTHRSGTVREMARTFRIKPQGIRYHLNNLISQGVVIAYAELLHKRGHPIKRYSLTAPHQTDNLLNLLDAVLSSLISENDPDVNRSRLHTIAVHLAGTPIHGRLVQRLNQAVDLLNQQAYQANWEAGPSGPRLLFAHCPYAAILPDHPELCMMDVQFLEYLLGVPIQQTLRQSLQPPGSTHCIFVPK